MNKLEALDYLENLRKGDSPEKIQFNFLFAEFSAQEDGEEIDVSTNPLVFGKYNAQKSNSYPFYKPYSKTFDITLIEKDVQNHV
ncbi:MAG: hypothetical protein IT256_07780 [Chitinophagaceae bacterium]|nr:hypothetical protein [Chitinophagaceae bacterium]MDI9319948.1 hypothetical protein [Phycisphaerales bacterium]